jgi:hypothetical protein
MMPSNATGAMTLEFGDSSGYATYRYRSKANIQVPLESTLKTLLFITKDKLDVKDKLYMPGLHINAVEN